MNPRKFMIGKYEEQLSCNSASKVCFLSHVNNNGYIPTQTPYPTITKVRVGAKAAIMAPALPTKPAARRITQAPQKSIRRPTKGAEMDRHDIVHMMFTILL